VKSVHSKEMFVCKRLKQMGFVRGQRLRLYGDEFDLEASPVPQGREYIVEGISHRTGSLRRVCIPITIVGLIESEFDVEEEIMPVA
jgi:hypothetical protein